MSKAARRESYRLRTIKRLATLEKGRIYKAMEDRTAAQLKSTPSAIGSTHSYGSARDVNLGGMPAAKGSGGQRALMDDINRTAKAYFQDRYHMSQPSVDTVTRIVDNLSATYDLDAVLVAIRDKVQRLADEKAPLEAAVGYTHETLINHLSRCVRLARRSGWIGTPKDEIN